jgi:hypothetical protein
MGFLFETSTMTKQKHNLSTLTPRQKKAKGYRKEN